MDLPAGFIDPVEAATRSGIAAGYMVAIVGKMFTGGETGGLADDLIALNHEAGAVGVFDDPFAAEQRDRVFGGVLDRNKVDESVRLVRGQTHSAVMVSEFVEPGLEAGQRMGAAGHGAKETHNFASSKRRL
jgi:hypothetical protein